MMGLFLYRVVLSAWFVEFGASGFGFATDFLMTI